VYEPDSGRCIGGPCAGKRLEPLQVVEHDGKVWLIGHNADPQQS
jgi:nitrite reductase/ring-hydroxylating ferredoxin subunit